MFTLIFRALCATITIKIAKGGAHMQDRYPVLLTEVGDVCIRSVLDNGFMRHSELAPEVHAHAFFELIIAVDGTVAIDVQSPASNGESIELSTSEVCIIPPGVYHSTRGISESAEKLAIRFGYSENTHTEKPSGSLYETVNNMLSSCIMAQKLANGLAIFEITREIRQEICHGGIASEEYLSTLLSQLYIRLFRLLYNGNEDGRTSAASAPSGGEDIRQIQIEDFIFTRLGDQITEEDLAAQMHLSKRQLSRVLRQLFGKSFRQMLIEARLNRATQLLADGVLSIEEVAALVGYTSLSGFYTAFRARFGISVGQYRRRYGSAK